MTPDERIGLLDALRGFSLFGVLLVNMSGFKFPLVSSFFPSPELHFPGMWNDLAKSATMWLAAGKFMPIFSLLFGVGLALQEQRATARGQAFGPFICWRMGLLVAAGVMHGILLWPGDILALYGLFGLLSPFLLKRSARTLSFLAIAISLIAIGASIFLTLSHFRNPVAHDTSSATDQWIEAYRHAPFAHYLQLRIQEWKMVWATTYVGDFSYAFLFFVLGLALGKSDRLAVWLSPDFKTTHSFKAAVVMALLLTLAYTIHYAGGFTVGFVAALLFYPAFMVGNWILSWGYIAGFARLHARMAGSSLMESFACVGRMSLTNYLLQSVIANVIFMSFGFGFYGKVSVAGGVAFSIAIFAGQMIFSRWWLSRHQSGPAEHLWRLLSYPR